MEVSINGLEMSRIKKQWMVYGSMINNNGWFMMVYDKQPMVYYRYPKWMVYDKQQSLKWMIWGSPIEGNRHHFLVTLAGNRFEQNWDSPHFCLATYIAGETYCHYNRNHGLSGSLHFGVLYKKYFI